MTKLRYGYLLSIVILAVALSACSKSTDEVTDTPEVTDASTEAVEVTVEPTDEATDEPTDEPAAQATVRATATARPTATVEATEDVTPEADVTESPNLSSLINNNGDYYISVSYTVDGSSSDEESELIVVSSLGNQTLGAVEVSAEDITLVDMRNNRYEPELPSTATQPPLIGAEVQPNESFLGLILFRLPPDTIPAYLEWCVGGDCNQSVQAPIP